VKDNILRRLFSLSAFRPTRLGRRAQAFDYIPDEWRNRVGAISVLIANNCIVALPLLNLFQPRKVQTIARPVADRRTKCVNSSKVHNSLLSIIRKWCRRKHLQPIAFDHDCPSVEKSFPDGGHFLPMTVQCICNKTSDAIDPSPITSPFPRIPNAIFRRSNNDFSRRRSAV